MITRPFWSERLEQAWREATIVWLAGVRRSGKTELAHSLGEKRGLYVNCDLPATERTYRKELQGLNLIVGGVEILEKPDA